MRTETACIHLTDRPPSGTGAVPGITVMAVPEPPVTTEPPAPPAPAPGALYPPGAPPPGYGEAPPPTLGGVPAEPAPDTPPPKGMDVGFSENCVFTFSET